MVSVIGQFFLLIIVRISPEVDAREKLILLVSEKEYMMIVMKKVIPDSSPSLLCERQLWMSLYYLPNGGLINLEWSR